MSDALDHYAKIEDLLGFDEISVELYTYYFDLLLKIDFQTLLDVGCGSGSFLELLREILPGKQHLGIDKSLVMVQRAKSKGINASHRLLQEVDVKFDIITATFDVLNYLDAKELKAFLQKVKTRLNEGGFFLCDLNTLFGLSEVAVGSVVTEDESRFVAIESTFKEGVNRSHFRLFEKTDHSCYTKKSWHIDQYYHEPDTIIRLSGLKLERIIEIDLYGFADADKVLLALKNDN